jgi:hypothetical protein
MHVMTRASLRKPTITSLGIGFLALAALAAPVQAQSVEGNWEGGIMVAGQELAFSLTVQDGDDGRKAFLNIPDNDTHNLELEDFSETDGAVSFSFDAGSDERVSFVGTLSGAEMSGAVTGPLPDGAEWSLTRTGDAELAAVPTIEVTPTDLTFMVGETRNLTVVVRDPEGNEIEADRLRFFARGAGDVTVQDGIVSATSGGEGTIIVLAVVGEQSFRQDVGTVVTWPPVDQVRLEGLPSDIQEGNSYRVEPVVVTEGGYVRNDLQPSLRSSNTSVISVSSTGSLRATGPGNATVVAVAEGVEQSWDLSVSESPVRSIELTGDRDRARTGDVVHVTARALDGRGRDVDNAPVSYSVEAFPIDTLIAPPSAASVDQNGAFVAEKPGAYVIHASSGRASASVEVQVEGREVSENIELMGQGAVSDVHTSDLWVWEGVDGRDYAVTGTWGAEGKAYFWDVTDPPAISKIDSVQVDARTVNDVKVSEDGRIAVISREGASNRKNGLVIFDVSDPNNVAQIGTYDEGMTGGVHNVFIYDNHIYALSAGQRYDIISIEDPSNPTKVGSFELDGPGHAIHDVWVEDGIAYSSNWSYGVVLVDVGNGIAGGSPSNPVQFASYAYPSGANHAAFPFRSQSTGKFYVVAGDEIMPGFNPDAPGQTAGYLHFIDFTDPDNPVEVARYQVPEAGTHNLWVEGDRLYAAFYNGGLRVIDISGELKGDLYRQGREIAKYMAYDPDGKVANAPMTWGPQPHKGHVFFSEFNSGLWAVKLEPRELVP